MKMSYSIIIIAIVAIAIIGSGPARMQIIHENPDKLSYQLPYDTDQELDNSLEGMFRAVEGFTSHITASDLNASRQDIEEFDQCYREYLYLLTLYNDPGPEYGELIPIIDEIRTDLGYLDNYTRLYALNQSRFNPNGSGSGLPGGNISGAGLRNSSIQMGQSAGEPRINVTTIRRLLKNSNIDMLRLENSLGLLESFADSSRELYPQQGWDTRYNYLNLSASSIEVSTGDRVDLTLKLAASNVTAAGRLIHFYAGDTAIGNASTGPDGTAVLSYRVGDSGFGNPIRFSARLAPSDDRLAPMTSNVVEVWHRPEMARLTVSVWPQFAVFGDHVRVWGGMTTDKAPVANRIVRIYLGGLLVGNATTLSDGSYSFEMSVDHFMPAGMSNIYARYESFPGYALLNGTSPNVTVMLGQSLSAITTDLQPVRYRGGDSITFAGSLSAGDARMPVKGANVSLYADRWLIGNATTDDGGSFAVSARIPYDITPGTHSAFVAYVPGTGKVLNGSLSEAVPIVFEAAAPLMTAGGAGLIAFSGDGVSVSGSVARTDGQPIAGCPVRIRLSGESLGNATTDASGRYTFAGMVPARFGLFSLTASVGGGELFSNTEVGAGRIFIMPIGKTSFIPGAVVAVGLAGIMAAWSIDRWVLRPGRQARMRLAATRIAVPAAETPLSYAGKVEGLLRQIGMDIAAGNDPAGVIANIYIATRLIARSQGIDTLDSNTPQEFRLQFAAAKPLVSPWLSEIIINYERAVFGHRQLTGQKLADSRNSLMEIHRIIRGEGA